MPINRESPGRPRYDELIVVPRPTLRATIEAERKARGLTRHQLATAAVVNPTRLHEYLNGSTGCRSATIDRVLWVLGLHPEDMRSGSRARRGGKGSTDLIEWAPPDMVSAALGMRNDCRRENRAAERNSSAARIGPKRPNLTPAP